MNTPPLRKLLKAVLAAAAATIAVLYIHTGLQQTYRNAGDDPQLQLASDAASALRAGADVSTVLPAGTVDLATGLAPFVIAYDSANRPIAGTGRLEGILPTPPAGVLATARAAGSYRVTWRPRGGVRVAAVLQRVDDGSGRVVLAARSLRPVEERTSRLLVMTALAWGALLVTSVIAALL